MNVLRQMALILAGAALAIGFLFTGGAAWADAMDFGASMMPGSAADGIGMGGSGQVGSGHMGGQGGHHQGGMGGHLGSMHGGEMPEECEAMMDDPEMMAHMMEMMHGGEPMEPAECQAWMDDHELPAEHQAECLEHMAEHQTP